MPFLQINSHHFFANYQALRQKITPNNPEKLAIVLKDNAYGHGLKEIAQLANNVKIPSAFVKNTKEALEIHSLFQHITILYPQTLPDEALLKECLEKPNLYFAVANLDFLNLLPKGAKIELKVNSGMNRNGICPTDLPLAFEKIVQNQLELVGIFTHNGFGDDLGSEFFTQQDNFLQIKKESLKLCENFHLSKPRFHSLSTSGALRIKNSPKNQLNSPELSDDLYRIGIGFYGYLCADLILEIPITLQPIASLWVNKISSLSLKKSQRIGYSGVSKLDRDAIVSTYDIGYGDGLFRLREGMELCTKEGFKILPRVSMDCLSIQSHHQCLCLFDNVWEWAKAFNTIPYEILSHLKPHIPKQIL